MEIQKPVIQIRKKITNQEEAKQFISKLFTIRLLKLQSNYNSNYNSNSNDYYKKNTQDHSYQKSKSKSKRKSKSKSKASQAKAKRVNDRLEKFQISPDEAKIIFGKTWRTKLGKQEWEFYYTVRYIEIDFEFDYNNRARKKFGSIVLQSFTNYPNCYGGKCRYA